MKRNHLITLAGGMVALAMTFAACSQDETTTIEKPTAAEEETVEEGPVVYTMHLNCEAPGYEENGTRATTTWANGSTIYLRFGSVAGTATYSSSSGAWTVATSGTLATTTSETTCYAYYFENPGTVTSTTVSLTEKSAIYQGTGKYTHPSSSDIYVTATLDPLTWRLRFNGGSVALMGSESDLNYNSAFNRSTGSFTTSKMGDVDLTSSDYVYGMFANTGDNRIQVQTDNVYYTTVSASKLQAKESGYLTAPNSSNYQAKNWIPKLIDDNATITQTNFCAFTDAMCTEWEVGSTVATFDYHVYTKEFAEMYTDDEMVDLVMDDDPNPVEYAVGYSWLTQGLTAGTDYCLCAVAKNSEGIRGPVLRYNFKALSENLPYAQISNVTAESTTKWTFNVALKNSAKSYYVAVSSDQDDFDGDWHWFAYYTYKGGVTGQLTARTWTSVAYTLNSGTCDVVTVCTWGIGTDGNIGNCNIAYGSTSSSARSSVDNGGKTNKMSMPVKDMKEKFSSTNVYLIEQ